MSTFLVPVDFSMASHKALQYALNLMNKEVDKLILFHVYSMPIPNEGMPVQVINNLAASYKDIAELHIEKMVEQTRQDHGDVLDIVAKTVPGTPVHGILDEIANQRVDLIVMGMHGKNKLLRKVMGTTATRVIQNTDIPVIVVPEDAEYAKIEKIAYASNFEEEDILALDRVINLAKSLEAEVRCVHIQTEAERMNDYKKEILEKAYQFDIKSGPIQIDVLANNNIIEGLNKYIEYNEVHIIVMLTHPKSIFNRILEGSSTWDMAFQSRVPVWVFQAKKNSTVSETKVKNILN